MPTSIAVGLMDKGGLAVATFREPMKHHDTSISLAPEAAALVKQGAAEADQEWKQTIESAVASFPKEPADAAGLRKTITDVGQKLRSGKKSAAELEQAAEKSAAAGDGKYLELMEAARAGRAEVQRTESMLEKLQESLSHKVSAHRSALGKRLVEALNKFYGQANVAAVTEEIVAAISALSGKLAKQQRIMEIGRHLAPGGTGGDQECRVVKSLLEAAGK